MKGIFEEIIDDLKEIYDEIWNVDIPSPTVPEYKEHHEQMVYLMDFVKAKALKYFDMECDLYGNQKIDPL